MQPAGLNATHTPQTNPIDNSVKSIWVQYQKNLNLVTIKGSSIGDHSSHKYDGLINDIETHFRSCNSLQLYFNYDFLDNSALGYLATVISVLNGYHERGKMVKVFWSCLSTADNISDEGQKLKSLSKFQFHL